MITQWQAPMNPQQEAKTAQISVKNFFQPQAAEPTKATVDSKSGERLSLTSLVDINFLHECTFPITLNPLFKYVRLSLRR